MLPILVLWVAVPGMVDLVGMLLLRRRRIRALGWLLLLRVMVIELRWVVSEFHTIRMRAVV
jgi:hypothetical protein